MPQRQHLQQSLQLRLMSASLIKKIQLRTAYFITVAPEIRLGSDILVLIFRALLQRRLMRPMFPMLGPEIPSIYSGYNQ